MHTLLLFHRISWKEILLFISPIFFTCGLAYAQGIPDENPLMIQAGIGFGRAGIAIGGENNSDFGVIADLNLQFRRYVLDCTWQSFKVTNPCRDEAFSSLYTLVSFQFGKTLYMRPGLGSSIQWWSGNDVRVSSELSPAAGFTAGYRFYIGKHFVLTTELIWRGSFGDETTTNLIGIQVFPSW